MVESSILGTSPWNSDPFLCKDLNPFPSLDCQLDMGFNSHDQPDDFWSSCGNDLANPLNSDSLGFETVNWLDRTDSSLTSSDCSTRSSSPRKRNSTSDPLTAGKSWSRMSAEEQLGTIEALTQIISHQMGLREQLEVIKIIDPVAVVSSADTEFVIDLACLDDVKLQRIRNYVHSHQLQFVPHMRNHGNSVNAAPSISSESSSGSNNSSNGTGYATNSPKPSKKQLRECKQLKAWHQRQHRQKLKEKRSGLFTREEVVSLTTVAGVATVTAQPQIEDDLEDIDILA